MQSFTIDSQTLYRGLGAVAISKGTDKHRPLLEAVRVEIDYPGFLRFVATDSYRMAIADVKIDNLAFECSENKVLEPFNLAGDFKPLFTMLKADKQHARVIVEERTVLVCVGTGAQVVLDRLEGTFPDYRQIINDVKWSKENQECAYNPAFMGDIGKAAMIFCNETRRNATTPVRISNGGKDRPSRFSVAYEKDTLEQWLMPVRVS